MLPLLVRTMLLLESMVMFVSDAFFFTFVRAFVMSSLTSAVARSFCSAIAPCVSCPCAV